MKPDFHSIDCSSLHDVRGLEADIRSGERDAEHSTDRGGSDILSGPTGKERVQGHGKCYRSSGSVHATSPCRCILKKNSCVNVNDHSNTKMFGLPNKHRSEGKEYVLRVPGFPDE